MAGDWIKFQVSTPDKPEVWQMADKLGIDPDAVVGKLLRVWAWFDEQTVDGNAENVTSVTAMSLLDRRVGVTGFCESMVLAGWMLRDGDTIRLPNFDRHNGKSAKNRANGAERQRKHRVGKSLNSNVDSVTQSVTEALPEKRREEKSNKRKVIKEKPVRDNPPTVEEVRAHMLSHGKADCSEEFHAYYTANGWVQGKSEKPIVNWKAAVTNWFVRRSKYDRESLFSKPEKIDPMYRPMTEVLAKESSRG